MANGYLVGRYLDNEDKTLVFEFPGNVLMTLDQAKECLEALKSKRTNRKAEFLIFAVTADEVLV